LPGREAFSAGHCHPGRRGAQGTVGAPDLRPRSATASPRLPWRQPPAPHAGVLASSRSSYITGTTMLVDGGLVRSVL